MTTSAGLVDDRTKRVVGGMEDYDLGFIKVNPTPTPEFLRANIISEVAVSYLTTLCNTISMPIATHFLAKAGKSDTFMKQMVHDNIICSQVCLNGLPSLDVQDGILQYENCCTSFCHQCFQAKLSCNECMDKGHTSLHPSLRACDRCLLENKICIKIAVLVTTDRESGNKNALESFSEEILDESIDRRLSALSVLPGAVHVGKSIKCSFCNWYLLLENERANLSILYTLRNDANVNIRTQFRKELTIDCVRNKDRMDVNSVIKISSNPVLDVLRKIGYAVHDIVPEKYRLTEDNKPGMFPHPVAIEFDDNGYFVFADYDPPSKTSRIVKCRLHNPVNLQVIQDDIRECRSITVLSGIYLACEYGIGILTVGVTKSISLNVSTLKSKQALKSGPDNLNLSADGTVADLKHRIKSHIDDLKQSGVNDKNLILNKEIKPCILTKADDDLAFCCSDHDKSFFQITVSNSGVRLEGNVSKLCSYPDNCKTIVDMCYQDGILYASCKGQNDSGGLISLDSSNNIFQRMVENTGTYDISGIC